MPHGLHVVVENKHFYASTVIQGMTPVRGRGFLQAASFFFCFQFKLLFGHVLKSRFLLS